ncbi:hypothetical protein Tco_1496744 [Tanacetum coccineum]
MHTHCYKKKLLPPTTAAQPFFRLSSVLTGQIEQCIDFSSFEIDANLRGWILLRLGYANYISPVSYFFLSADISFVFNIVLSSERSCCAQLIFLVDF